jgi:hypothetical protein
MKQLGENVIWSFSSLKLATLRQGQFWYQGINWKNFWGPQGNAIFITNGIGPGLTVSEWEVLISILKIYYSSWPVT